LIEVPPKWSPERRWPTSKNAPTSRSSTTLSSAIGTSSPAEKWAEFDEAWKRLLYVHNLDYSHAVDLIHKKRQFKGWDNNRHNDFILAAREIINAHIGSGFVAIVRRDDFANFYKRPEKPRRIPVDTSYGVLFRGCVSFCLGVVAYSLNEKVDDEVVSFVLERGGVKAGYIKDLYGRFKTDRHADPALRGILGPKVGFAKKDESPGCQAADLMLGGAIRQERTEHAAQPSQIEQSSFADISKPIDAEDVPTFRIPVGQRVLESLRENMFVEEAERREWWEKHRRGAPRNSR